MRKWTKKNLKKRVEGNKRWRHKNREKFRAWQRQYWARPENKIKKAEWDRKWQEKNKEKKAVMDKNYRATHQEQERKNSFRKQYRKRNAEGSFTLKEWQVLKKKSKYRCIRCGDDKDLTADHIIPLSKGGTNYISNIQLLCRSCNSKKHTKIYA